ncbi:O-antigen/teichoic acid export membrane protein [Roseivirga pacifica]|uniref:Membrane protein involved in the export of O-antigen and teichoic acid n=1 Tax=Roseivirga pacifica TaxID=1267423 RepID=A0A1I0N7U1_9BACT|nr:flippase [Roseivirga pacifica]RKQ50977.1 O-antigen/teichoic acid export membrane protein [Roseivirga pacifica]SEV97002.1 Membrane protein involved in the export of O-antigen and teichoic acid [Roseivirga pacifica]
MSIKKNYSFNLLNSLLNIIFPIITFPYAARILSPEGIGEVQFIFSFAQYFSILAAFGMPIYGVKAIASAKGNSSEESRVASTLILLSIITATIAFAIFFVSVQFVAPSKNSFATNLIAGLLILFGFLNVDWFFSGRQEFKLIALRSFIVKLFSLSILFFFVKEPEDTFPYLLFLVFLYVGNYILNFTFLMKRIKLSLKDISIKPHLKPLTLIFSMAVATTIYTTLDVVILGLLSNERQVGLYTAAVKLSKVSLPILTSLGLVVIPKATQILASGPNGNNKLFSKSFSFIVLLAVPMCAGIYLLAPESVILFSGIEFIEAAEVVKVLSLLPLLIGIGHFASFQILVPLNKNAAISISTFVGVILFLLATFLLIPKFGSTGAAVATVSTELVVSGIYLLFIPKELRLHLPWKKIPYAIASCLLFIPIVLSLRANLNSELIIFLSSVCLCLASYLAVQHFLFKEGLVKEVFAFLKSRGR